MSIGIIQCPSELPVNTKSWRMTKAKKPQMSQEFWDWYDGIRRERDLNDTGMARISGIDQSVISKARTGDRPIGAEALTKMADGLGVSRVFVLRLGGWITKDDVPSVIDSELAQLWERLGTDDREEILALMKVKVKRERAGGSQKTGR